MTVTVTSTIEGPLTPNGVATAFGFPFKVLTGEELEVYRGDPGAWSLIDDALYSVTINPDEGGQVVFTTAPETGSGPLYIVSAPSYQQQGGFAGGEVPFTPVAVGRLLDQAAIRALVLRRDVGRAIKVPPGSTPLEMGEVAEGEIVGNVAGKLAGLPNDVVGAADSAAQALAAKVETFEARDETEEMRADASASKTAAAVSAATSQQARDQAIAALLTAPGRIQNNPATPTVPPAGLADGDRYLAVDVGGKTASLYTQTGPGVGAIASPLVQVPLKGHIDTLQRTAVAAADRSLGFVSAVADIPDDVLRLIEIKAEPGVVIPDKLVLRAIARDHFGAGGSERTRIRVHKVTGAGTGGDPYVYTAWGGLGLSNSDLNTGGLLGIQPLNLLAVDNVTHPGFTNGQKIASIKVKLDADFGNLGTQYDYPAAGIDTNKLKIDPALEAQIRVISDQRVDFLGATMLRADATDLFAKKTFGPGVVENGDALDDYFKNYRFDKVPGAGMGGSDLYRAQVWLHSTLRGAPSIAYYARAGSGAPPALPPHLRLSGMADGTHQPGDVGIEAIVAIRPPLAAEYVHNTAYSNATATGIQRTVIRTTQETREKWTAPAVPAGANEIFIASSGGAQYASVVEAIAAVTNVDVATVARTTYPAALSYSPARPIIFRIVGAHNEEVIPYTYLGVGQSPLRMPHGSALITRPDTLIWMNSPGSEPVIEANMTVFFDGTGEIKQFGTGYVIHIDNGNGISSQPTEPWIRRPIVTRIGGLLLHKVLDSATPHIGSGISDDHDWMADGTRFLFDANSVGSSAITIHTSPGCVHPGRIDLRNLTFSGIGAGNHLTLLKSHVQTARHRLCVTNSEITRIGHGNSVAGTSPIPGFVRGCPLTGVTVTGVSLDP